MNTLFVACILVAAAVSPVLSIKCYKCDSSKGEVDCVLGDTSMMDRYKVDCTALPDPDGYVKAHGGYTRCVKEVGVTASTTIGTVRGCQTANAHLDPKYTNDVCPTAPLAAGEAPKKITCFCSTDNCNAATGLQAAGSSLFLFSIAFLMARGFL